MPHDARRPLPHHAHREGRATLALEGADVGRLAATLRMEDRLIEHHSPALATVKRLHRQHGRVARQEIGVGLELGAAAADAAASAFAAAEGLAAVGGGELALPAATGRCGSSDISSFRSASALWWATMRETWRASRSRGARSAMDSVQRHTRQRESPAARHNFPMTSGGGRCAGHRPRPRPGRMRTARRTRRRRAGRSDRRYTLAARRRSRGPPPSRPGVAAHASRLTLRLRAVRGCTRRHRPKRGQASKRQGRRPRHPSRRGRR
eukprot:scaffold6639_cov63-Phaeocystis_antarctica.AAC.5